MCACLFVVVGVFFLGERLCAHLCVRAYLCALACAWPHSEGGVFHYTDRDLAHSWVIVNPSEVSVGPEEERRRPERGEASWGCCMCVCVCVSGR